MIACNFLLLSFSLLIARNYAVAAEPNDGGEVQCLHPEGHNDKSVSREYCAYGINDQGDIYFNGEKDVMNLTNAVLKRKTEINTKDDVVVNLYNPLSGSMAIFYYGCRKCEDLKKIGHLTVPKLRIFLLSLYNQRMKHNIRYSQSDFNPSRFEENMSQPLPIIDVRPFWKNRLMLGHTCAGTSLKFTQKHFIPAFLTQDICAINYEYVNDTVLQQFFITEEEIIYSMTLSNNGLYQYLILPNSTTELPQDIYYDRIAMCKLSFTMTYGLYSTRFFCLCEDRACHLQIINTDPRHYCTSNLTMSFSATEEYTDIVITTEYMAVKDFFMVNGCQDKCNTPNATYSYCYLIWTVENGTFFVDIYKNEDGFRSTYEFYTNYSQSYYKRSNLDEFGNVVSIYYKNDTSKLQEQFLETFLDHVKLKGAPKKLIGANCREEMPLSDPLFSSSYGAKASEFPCYKYFDIYNKRYVYPLMGINMMPVSISKGKECYFYKMKVDHSYRGCKNEWCDSYMVTRSLVVCPENIDYDEEEVEKVKRMHLSCPISIPGTNQFVYDYLENSTRLCGQFLRGIKLQNGRYVPDQVELKFVTNKDLKSVGLKVEGCGFNASQNLTLCTCAAALGGCEKLYTAGRVHLLRYLPSP